ncbi:hypothetical protein GCM10023186_29420 [Hymenobacter koreensis]|uniref:Uncharacterized protein n=1 Tax=Hymenobacter koreensis TaxID=1084523 RepID=A0ABP8J635_9BACT
MAALPDVPGCYGEDAKSWRAGCGLADTAYEVLLNQDFLLQQQSQYYYQGLSEPATLYLPFDLRMGCLLTSQPTTATRLPLRT